MASSVTLTPPQSFPTPTDPGYIMSLTLAGKTYHILAYCEDENGGKTYLPSDNESFEKVRSLAWGLFNAHDYHRKATNGSFEDVKEVDKRGLIKNNGSIFSHDFAIAPYSTSVAEQMQSSLTLAG